MTKKEIKDYYESIYPHYRISHLAVSLAQNKVSKEIIDEILSGGENIQVQKDKNGKVSDNKNVELTAWFRDAMGRMERLLDDDTRYKVREACACCTGGKRHEMATQICKNNDSLESRIHALNEASFIVGQSVDVLDENRIRVVFGTTAEKGSHCPCLCLSDEAMPITYCYCCGGHIKHHVQAALGIKVNCKVVSSLLSSSGKKPCVFEFEMVKC